MQFLIKVIVLFLIVFNFRVPILYNTAIVTIIISSIYYIFKREAIPFTYFFQRYNAVILIGTLGLALVLMFIGFLHNTDIMSLMAKRVLVEFVMLVAIVFALPLLIDDKKSTTFEEIAVVICYAFALQGLISLTAYLYSPLGNYLMHMKASDIILADEEAVLDNRFRYLNLSGTTLVELTAAFGVAHVVFFWLQLKSDHPYMKEWRRYIIFAFIFLGTVFAGRTGFIGFLLGFGGWLLFSFNSIFTILRRNMTYIIGSASLVLFIYFIVFSNRQREAFDNEVFPFAFEWYYRYKNEGRAEVGSMAATQYHYYYLTDETLVEGLGMLAAGGTARGTEENNGEIYTYSYGHSDAGYTNTLVFGGIPLLICLIIYQSFYFARPIAIALRNNSRTNRIFLVYFLILFVYIFIVDIKAPAVGYLHLVEVMYLALGSSYVMQYYSEREQNNLNG